MIKVVKTRNSPHLLRFNRGLMFQMFHFEHAVKNLTHFHTSSYFQRKKQRLHYGIDWNQLGHTLLFKHK